MKKALLLLVVLGALAGGGYAYYKYSNKKVEPTITTAALTRGDIVDTVGSTGALSAVSQVQVGSQVSGIILALGADFNDIVKKGQVLARLDPTTVETQILQAKANLIRSQTDIDRSKVSLEDAQKKYDRSKELSARGIVTQADLDTAELNLHSAQSSLKSAQAALQQSDASLKQNEVNLEHTIILSPIDGTVISRAMDVGQTVSASMSAPTLFTIAADLTKMKVIAGVDESDVARIRPNQHVTFRVDAYPTETFDGTVEQVRLEPKMQQNVVTYQTVISVPNDAYKLKPGMTANINIEISRINDVLRVSSAALRFRPTADMYTALGLEPPADQGRGGRGGGRGGPGRDGGAGATPSTGAPAAGAGRQATATPGSAPNGATAANASGAAAPAAAPVAAPAGAPVVAPQRSADARPSGGQRGGGRGGAGGFGGFGGGTAEERAARMQNMTPEERAAMMARGGGRGGNRGGDRTGGATGGRGGFGGPNGGGRGGGSQNGQNAQAAGRGGRSSAPSATELRGSGGGMTIDALFPALVMRETRGGVWTWDKNKKALTRVSLRLGISDGQNTQVVEGGDLKEGSEVVTNIITAAAVRPGLNQQQGNPFFQGPGGGRGGPGGNPGGGGGGGGNRGGGGGRGF